MSKFAFLAAIATVVLVSATANAQYYSRDRGPETKSRVACPPGTCGPKGGSYPTALSLCSAVNCKKTPTPAVTTGR
jgi:hypothetical protein